MKCVLRVHRACAGRSEHHAVRAVIEDAIDTHTGQVTQNRRFVCVPDNQKHALGRVGGGGADNFRVLACKRVN